jgi:hypothetical protein
MSAASPLRLTPDEHARGWCEYLCPDHGTLVVANANCVVWCRCGRRAQRSLNGTPWKVRDSPQSQNRVQKPLQREGSVSRSGALTPRTPRFDRERSSTSREPPAGLRAKGPGSR